jgi:hypothetical protein
LAVAAACESILGVASGKSHDFDVAGVVLDEALEEARFEPVRVRRAQT